MKIVIYIFYMLILAAGVALGGFLFSDSIARPFISIEHCKSNCLKTKELAGLLASVGIQRAGAVLPKVFMETDKTLVFDIQYPYPADKIHYAVVPKKDIKDASQLTAEDGAYIADAYSVMGQMVRNLGYPKYVITTNGPGYQEVTYLHFHLVIDRD